MGSGMRLFLLQLPAVVGVLLGILVTHMMTTFQERSRWRRQQAVRWDERRIAAYTDYAHAVKRVISIAVRLAAKRGVYEDDFWFSVERSPKRISSWRRRNGRPGGRRC